MQGGGTWVLVDFVAREVEQEAKKDNYRKTKDKEKQEKGKIVVKKKKDKMNTRRRRGERKMY